MSQTRFLSQFIIDVNQLYKISQKTQK